MMNITSHVLNTSTGKPAAGIPVLLFFLMNGEWNEISRAITNKDGRVPGFEMNNAELITGTYKLKFATKSYFHNHSVVSFYPFVEIVFEVTAHEHYHVPLLLNPFGYSTYRGS